MAATAWNTDRHVGYARVVYFADDEPPSKFSSRYDAWHVEIFLLMPTDEALGLEEEINSVLSELEFGAPECVVNGDEERGVWEVWGELWIRPEKLWTECGYEYDFYAWIDNETRLKLDSLAAFCFDPSIDADDYEQVFCQRTRLS